MGKGNMTLYLVAAALIIGYLVFFNHPSTPANVSSGGGGPTTTMVLGVGSSSTTSSTSTTSSVAASTSTTIQCAQECCSDEGSSELEVVMRSCGHVGINRNFWNVRAYVVLRTSSLLSTKLEEAVPRSTWRSCTLFKCQRTTQCARRYLRNAYSIYALRAFARRA